MPGPRSMMVARYRWGLASEGRPQVAVRPRQVGCLGRQAPEDPPFHPLADGARLHCLQDLLGLRPLAPQDVQPGLEQPGGGAGRQLRDQRACFGWRQGERDAKLLERGLCPAPVVGAVRARRAWAKDASAPARSP